MHVLKGAAHTAQLCMHTLAGPLHSTDLVGIGQSWFYTSNLWCGNGAKAIPCKQVEPWPCSTVPQVRPATQKPRLHAGLGANVYTTHLLGMRKSLSPFLTMPASLLPIAMAPMSLYLSMIDILKGERGSRGRGSVTSSISNRVPPRYQGHFLGSTAFMMLSPSRPEIGRNTRSFLGL